MKFSKTLSLLMTMVIFFINLFVNSKIDVYANNVLNSKKICFIGDSICYGNGYVGGYAKIIQKNNNTDIQNLGIGSTFLSMEHASSSIVTKINGKRTIITTLKNGKFEPSLVNFNQYDDFGKIRYSTRQWNSTTHQYDYTEVFENEWDHTSELFIYKHSIPELLQYINYDCDYIICEGGLNDYICGLYLGDITNGYDDYIDTHSVIGGLEYLCRQLKNNYSNKKVGFIVSHKTNNSSSYYDQEYFFQKIKQVCAKYNIPCLDLYDSEFDTNNVYYLQYTRKSKKFPLGDGVHPTEQGYKLFYVPQIELWIKQM